MSIISTTVKYYANVQYMKHINIGMRLKTERLRLGLTQQAFANLVHVSKSSQSGYEAGSRVPDAHYLDMAHRIGVDIMYVITGDQLPTITTDHFNWEKLAKISYAIDLWLAEKHLNIPHDKKMRLAEHIYRHFLNADTIENSSVNKILALVS